MEKLTFDGNFCDIAQCTSTPGGSLCEDGSCSARKVWERLKAYEETGLTPEEIDMDHEAAEQLRHLCRNCDLDRLEKLAEADRDGRVVVLPCQFGEHVFALLDGQKRVRECEVKYAVLDGWLKVFYLAPIDDPGNLYGAPFGAFGQTVFLTPREGGESIGGDEG